MAPHCEGASTNASPDRPATRSVSPDADLPAEGVRAVVRAHSPGGWDLRCETAAIALAQH